MHITVLPGSRGMSFNLAFLSPDGAKIERIIGFFGPLRRESE